jgi:hypothetical protein
MHTFYSDLRLCSTRLQNFKLIYSLLEPSIKVKQKIGESVDSRVSCNFDMTLCDFTIAETYCGLLCVTVKPGKQVPTF